MRQLFTILLFTCSVTFLSAQSTNVDSLKQLLSQAKEDTTKVKLMIHIATEMSTNTKNLDSQKTLLEKALQLSQKSDYKRGEMRSYYALSQILTPSGNYPAALELLLKALDISQRIKAKTWTATITDAIGLVYLNLNDYRQGLQYSFKARKMFSSTDNLSLANNSLNIGYGYLKLNRLDSALIYLNESYQLSSRTSAQFKADGQFYMGYALQTLGDVWVLKGNNNLADDYYRIAINVAKERNDSGLLANCYLGLAQLFNKINLKDSAFKYAAAAIGSFVYANTIIDANVLMSNLFESIHNSDSALHYYKVAMTIKDSTFNQEKTKQIQYLFFKEQLRQQEIEKQQEQYRNKVKVLALSGGFLALLIIATILWRNNQYKKKANNILLQKNKEIQTALINLKSTQAQLVQREKMASLGELTAGIAHEIQNPLNFVNNFSEVSTELIDEMEEALQKEDKSEALTLASDIKENLQKINQHGKRADSIVKGMLQHSRQSSGNKEPTDINALVEEYLRLSYHGMRAKDKTFTAVIETHFDDSIQKATIVSQDIGRVLLNIFNNAFYTENEKKKKLNGTYEPTISVSTKKERDGITITVKDNGNGISQKIIDKIFQPFFTTKPTGQGTGLGLSLSYDIIKAHGGEITVESTEGEGTAFIIQLPI